MATRRAESVGLMSYRLWIVWGLLGASCGKCGNTSVPEVSEAGPRRVGATDLRSALFTVFPEFRYAILTRGSALVERTVEWKLPAQTSLVDAVRPHALAKGFSVADSGHDFVHAPFALDVESLPDGRVRLWVGLPITQADVGKLLQSPSPMGTDALAHWLPDLPQSRRLEENFVFKIQYQGSSEARTDFLVRQMVDLLQAGDWKVESLPEGWELNRRPDGGVGGVPSAFSLRLKNVRDFSTIAVERKGTQVAVTLRQELWK